MRSEYDFSKGVKNPYVQQKRQITIRLDSEVVEYFKSMSTETDIPYQTLINMYLMDCVKSKRKLISHFS